MGPLTVQNISCKRFETDKSTTYADQNNNQRVHFSRHDIELFVGTMLKIILMSRYHVKNNSEWE
ncbi:hypothetical protein T03_8386 [Trichinella britovi]|uniref:Uncharacterized protein n=1 Tax=Trichinella britovi TaxID=45882 RepID=A0A0V1AK89_TRIBR|nr:hypothetical protein T03_8386 [Trichinella britovi]